MFCWVFFTVRDFFCSIFYLLPYLLSFFAFSCDFSPLSFPLFLFTSFPVVYLPSFLSNSLSHCFFLSLHYFCCVFSLFCLYSYRYFFVHFHYSLIIMFVSLPHSFLACCSYEISVSHSPTLPITRSDWLIKAL